MINSKTAEGAQALASLLASKSLYAVAQSGTPLASLVKTTNDCMTFSCVANGLTPEQELADHAGILSMYTTTTGDMRSAHDIDMDAYINDISAAVRNHISFAKNVVRPLVLDMAEKVQKSMAEVRSVETDFSVVMVELPSPMRNSGFEDSVSKYAGKTPIKPSKELTLDEKTIEEIFELLQTGSKEYDSHMAEWFTTKDPIFFLNIWNNLFRDFKKSKPLNVFNIEEAINDRIEGVDSALCIHLLSRKLFDEVPENTGMPLELYKDLVAQYREISGIKLNQEYTRYNAVLKNNTLVVGTDPNRKTIRVNGAPYREWIKTGGSNEILLGMLTTDETLFTAKLIDEKRVKFQNAWTQYTQYANTAMRNNAFNQYRSVLISTFGSQFINLSPDEKDLYASKPGMIQKIEEYFKATIDELVTADMNDVHEMCLRLICRSRFFYTDAEKILRGINEAVAANPGIDIRSAALLSTIEYVADYLSDQIKVIS